MMKKSKYLSKKDIENEATLFLNQYYPISLIKPSILNLEDIIESKLNLKLEYQQLDEKGNVLGMTVFKTGYLPVISENQEIEKIVAQQGTIILNSILADDIKQQNRYQFTLAHEIGHWILQRKELLYDENQTSLFDTIQDLSEKDSIKCLNRSVNPEYNTLITDLDWLEWQANYFASAILMPKIIFLKELSKLNFCTEENRILELSKIFGVSKQAVRNRINSLQNKDKLNNQIEF